VRDDCIWRDECVFCETYGHCATERKDIHYRNAQIEAFQIFSPHSKDINIKGVFDNRYFEELDSPLQYLVDGKLQWDFPENPYKKGTAQYANYQEMVESLPEMGELIEKIIETGASGFIEAEIGYMFKVENIGDYNDSTGIAAMLDDGEVVDGEHLNSYYDFNLIRGFD
jgi:hypothetical protein